MQQCVDETLEEIGVTGLLELARLAGQAQLAVMGGQLGNKIKKITN